MRLRLHLERKAKNDRPRILLFTNRYAHRLFNRIDNFRHLLMTTNQTESELVHDELMAFLPMIRSQRWTTDYKSAYEKLKNYIASARETKLLRKQLAEEKNGYSFCPNCGRALIHANTGNLIDTYCEDCGWPDEKRNGPSIIDEHDQLKADYKQALEALKELHDYMYSNKEAASYTRILAVFSLPSAIEVMKGKV